RIAFGETAEVGMRIDNAEGATGAEEILVIAVPARDGAMRTVLTGLGHGGTNRTAGIASPVEAWLSAAANPDGPSRALPGASVEPIKVIRLRVLLSLAAAN